MSILVAYASRHGATRGIAERIAATLVAAGLEAEALPVTAAGYPAAYDALVIGSAAYRFHWQQEAAAFVRRNGAALATRPVWLFSSGPLGSAALDAYGRDPREEAVPREMAVFRKAIHPRDHHVFFGALTQSSLDPFERLLWKLPAVRRALPEGDFRDWREIDDWAGAIAREVAHPASDGH